LPPGGGRLLCGGVFELTVGGQLRFSKKREGRFPTEEEMAQAIA
jgi:selT/selW/selH-like putative selenoprotein